MDNSNLNDELAINPDNQLDGEAPGGYREIWRVAYPLILMNASHTIMQFIDRKFLAMNSIEDVAAAAPAGILCFTLMSFFLVTTNFCGAVVAQFDGRNYRRSCAKAPWAGFYFSLAAGLICSYPLLLLGDWLIELGQHTAIIAAKEKSYFDTLMPGSGFMCMCAAFCGFFSGRGKTWYVTWVHFIACLANVGLDYVLIFGKLGFPKLGIAGAGLATTISAGLAFLITFVLFIMQKQSDYPTRSEPYLNLPDIRRLFRFGAPHGVQVSFEVGSFAFVIFMIGNISDQALTATTIVLSINMISFLPLLGLSEATSIVVGKYIGRGRLDISEKAAYKSWGISMLYMSLMAVLFCVFPSSLINVFAPREVGVIDFQVVLHLGRLILFCVAFFNFLDATLFIFVGALRGAGDTMFPMWVRIILGWGLLAPGTTILIFVLKSSVVGVWMFITFYIFVIAVFMVKRFRTGKWKHVKMLEAF